MFWRRARRIEAMVVSTLKLVLDLDERMETWMSQLDDLIASLNSSTNAVAAHIDKLLNELAGAGQAPTNAQLQALQDISDHLKAMGADASAPIPALAPAAVPKEPSVASVGPTFTPPPMPAPEELDHAPEAPSATLMLPAEEPTV